jgi:hypothetical protein
MDTLTSYTTGVRPVNSPVTGHYLAQNRKLSIVQRAYLGADLHNGKCLLAAPTVLQSAMLARVNVTYVHHALKQAANRYDIERGLLPLVPPVNPPPVKHPPVPLVDDAEILNFVRKVGVPRVLDAAVAVEAAQ